jgi:hypothetical protein
MEPNQPFKSVKQEKFATYYSIQVGRIAGQSTETIVICCQRNTGLGGPKRNTD